MVDIKDPHIGRRPQAPAESEGLSRAGRPDVAAPTARRTADTARATDGVRDQFRQSNQLERFAGVMRQRAEREGPQSFRLPSGRVIVVPRRRDDADDKRATRERGADATTEGKAEQQRGEEKTARRGKAFAEAVPKNAKEQAAATAQQTQQSPDGAKKRAGDVPQAFAQKRVRADHVGAQPVAPKPSADKAVSEFETAAVARFEGGEEQAQQLPDGQPKFLQKTTQQWKDFFKAFLPRSVVKEIPMAQLAEGHIFRALLQKAGEVGTGVLISDLALASGLVEKFTRIELPLDGIVQHLQFLPAGATVPTTMLEQQLQADQLRYVAIRSRGLDDAGPATAQRDTGGMFMAQRTETMVAAHLGLRPPHASPEALDVGHGSRAKGRRRGLLDGDDPTDEFRRHVIPGWWDREKRRGPSRWFVPVTLGVLLTFLIVSAWVILRSL